MFEKHCSIIFILSIKNCSNITLLQDTAKAEGHLCSAVALINLTMSNGNHDTKQVLLSSYLFGRGATCLALSNVAGETELLAVPFAVCV
jgi:hypothetical protein